MNAELDIRLKAFNRSISVLELPENLLIWKNKTPEVFTTKYDDAVLMVATLEDAAKKQETGHGGVTAEKDREEAELENADFVIAQALVTWFRDHQQETEAGELDLPLSVWQRLPNQPLLAKSQLLTTTPPPSPRALTPPLPRNTASPPPPSPC